MDELDDRPLARTPVDEPLTAPPRRPTGATLLLIAAIGLACGAAAAWWWFRSSRTEVPGPPAIAVSDQSVPIAPAPPARALPPLDQMDTFLRALVGALSSHPDLVRWLATEDLVRQLAHGLDRLSQGQTPARDLAVLRPARPFQVVRRGSQTTIDPASFRRYDGLAALVQSLDAQAVADAYRTVEPRLDEAYRALGRSEGRVGDAVTTTLRLLIATPIPDEPVAVVPAQGSNFAFADPRYESLRPAQKQLLRMGPANARRVQARLREIAAALERK